MTDKTFHMPICRSEFFEERTLTAINTFLDAGHVFEGARIIALVTDYQVHHEDRENVAAIARLDFLGEEEDGQIRGCDPRRFEDPDLKHAFAELAAAWTTDDLAVQSVAFGILSDPPTRPLVDPATGKLYRHIQARDFALFGREYPATAASQLGDDIVGPNASLYWRRHYMNLVLPPVETAHEKIEEAATYERIRSLIPRIYAVEMDFQDAELPLAPLDFSEIRDVN